MNKLLYRMHVAFDHYHLVPYRMNKAYTETKEIAKKYDVDMRTAAYIHAINRVLYALEKG